MLVLHWSELPITNTLGFIRCFVWGLKFGEAGGNLDREERKALPLTLSSYRGRHGFSESNAVPYTMHSSEVENTPKRDKRLNSIMRQCY